MTSIPDALLASVDALIRDIQTTGLRPTVGVFDLHTSRWLLGSGVDPTDFGPDGYVLRVENNEHLIAPTDTGEPDPADVASYLQDWVTDELGVGWPETYEPLGTFTGILEPTMVQGNLMWVGGGGETTPVGGLTPTP